MEKTKVTVELPAMSAPLSVSAAMSPVQAVPCSLPAPVPLLGVEASENSRPILPSAVLRFRKKRFSRF